MKFVLDSDKRIPISDSALSKLSNLGLPLLE